MIRIPGGPFVFKVGGTEIEGGGNPGRRCAVSVGGFAAPFSPKKSMQVCPVLHRQVSGHPTPSSSCS